MELVPWLLLPRACLPLAYLDSEVRQGAVGYPRFLEGSFSALDVQEDEAPEIQGPRVLIVEDQSSRRLYAVERVRNRTYTICRLGQWVTVYDFGSAPAGVKKRRCDGQFTTATGGNEWWRKAALDFKRPCFKSRCSDESNSSCRARLSLKPPRSEPLLPGPKGLESQLGAVKSACEPVLVQNETNISTDAALATSTDPGDIHDMIRASYLEDLYIKKVRTQDCHQSYH